jgi:A/G-specific adenine glycosylase
MPVTEMPASAGFATRLLDWYGHNGRQALPWRQEPTPYRVWLSEIMLQQTQVATVLPYYQRFLQRFPDLASLAAAPLEEVLGLWAGLGYYSRARHLHRTAQTVATQYGGSFPASLEALAALPGIGRSTAGAILAIAFRRRAAILDGNVKRILARHGGIEGWPGEAAVGRRLWVLSEALLPEERIDDYTQAIMDLGALVCSRSKPACRDCPVAADCRARLDGRIAQLPGQRPGKALPTRECYFLLLRDPAGRLYLEQKPAPGLWGGLWSFPEFSAWDDLLYYSGQWRVEPGLLETLPSARHTFSHYHLQYTPVLAAYTGKAEGVAEPGGRWADPRREVPPMPTPIQRLYRRYAAA